MLFFLLACGSSSNDLLGLDRQDGGLDLVGGYETGIWLVNDL